MLDQKQLSKFLQAYTAEEAKKAGMNMRDQVLIEHLKVLISIRKRLTFFVVITVIWILFALLGF